MSRFEQGVGFVMLLIIWAITRRVMLIHTEWRSIMELKDRYKIARTNPTCEFGNMMRDWGNTLWKLCFKLMDHIKPRNDKPPIRYSIQ